MNHNVNVVTILGAAGKILLAPVLLCVFLIARLFQFFLKICGPVVTFVCVLSSVVVTLGAVAQILLYVQGRGISIWGIFLSVLIAVGLAIVPAVGVGMVMFVLEGLCTFILRLYKPAMEKIYITSEKKPDYRWADYEWDNKAPNVHLGAKEEGERKIHYFKGIHDKEELRKRFYALMRIYRPENEFGEDEVTKSIVDEFDYLKGRLPEKEEHVP